MTLAFFTPAEIASLADFVEPGLQSQMIIYRRIVTTPSNPSDDYGDDELEFPVVNNPTPGTEYATSRVRAWLYQSLSPLQLVDTSQIVTPNTDRVFVPLGTDIRPGDEIEMLDPEGNAFIGADGQAQRYTVSDTNNDVTWKTFLSVSLRLLE